MNNRSPSGLQDDEALLAYLTGGKDPLRWQLVYTRFRATQVEVTDAAKFAKAFATWLDDLRDGHFTQPLQHSLYTIFLAYLDCDGNDKVPPYLAGDSLTLALKQDQKNAHDALVKMYREPAQAILNQRQSIPAADFADAYQNAQLNLLEKPPAADQPLRAQLFSWFMRVLTRRVIDWQREQGKTSEWVSPEDVKSSLAEESSSTYDVAYWNALNDRYQIEQRFGNDDARKVISKALEKMEAGCRDLIRKRYIFNYAYKKIATQNEYSVDSVGQRIKRCLKKLRQVMIGTNS